MCQDSFLAYMYAIVRTLRLADGPDEVHAALIGRMELNMAGGSGGVAKL